ncbi:FAD-dependent oxidoreductase [Kribbella sp. NPDC050820]|uniref:NAD(P)/FAD-dependent oxidoreductase n=1 Tax=Kribbella sp. NPDC050820 TaxID=3155408 RepID=UPI0033F725A2
MMRTLEKVVIVGAGAAAVSATEALRAAGFSGQLLLIGAETHLPYDRPPLSKHVLTGRWNTDRTALRNPRAMAELGVDLRLGATATGLDLTGRAVELNGTDLVTFDGLIITTGVDPRRLVAGHNLRGVHLLRTLDDATALRDALRHSHRIVVIGAGVLGCEIAAAARTLDVDVTVVDVLQAPMVRALGDTVGGIVADLHRGHGTQILTNQPVDRLLGDDTVSGVRLTCGTVLPADLVVVAIGAAPATDWLASSGLVLNDGIVCDTTCRAAPGVYAAGDVARWHHPRMNASLRVEHRLNATEQGIVAARNLLGANQPYSPVPFFWSDQFDTRIQAYGHFPPAGETHITEGDPVQGKFIAHYLSAGRVTGLVGWNMPAALRTHRPLLND